MAVVTQSTRPTAVVLSIAGSDSSGGAGIQADIKTGAAFGVFVATAITAITAQNSAGVTGIYPMTADQLQAQIDAVLNGLPVAAIKIGMLANIELAETVARAVAATKLPVVLDPVMGATSGSSLMTVQLFRCRINIGEAQPQAVNARFSQKFLSVGHMHENQGLIQLCAYFKHAHHSKTAT